MILFFIIGHNFFLVVFVHAFQNLKVLQISLPGRHQRLGFDTQSFRGFVWREYVHSEHLRFPLKHIFILRQISKRNNLCNIPTVGARYTHHVRASLPPELRETSLAEGMTALQDTWHLKFTVKWKCADLTLYRRALFILFCWLPVCLTFHHFFIFKIFPHPLTFFHFVLL